MASASLLYFLTMVASWTFSWLSGDVVPNELHEYVMYCGAVFCALSSAVVMFSTARRKLAVAGTATGICLVLFCIIYTLSPS